MKCKSRCFATKNESDNVIIGKRSLLIKSDTSMEAAGWIIFQQYSCGAFANKQCSGSESEGKVKQKWKWSLHWNCWGRGAEGQIQAWKPAWRILPITRVAFCQRSLEQRIWKEGHSCVSMNSESSSQLIDQASTRFRNWEILWWICKMNRWWRKSAYFCKFCKTLGWWWQESGWKSGTKA